MSAWKKGDGRKDIEIIANKVLGLRIFEGRGRKDEPKSLWTKEGSLLVVSQFTLLGGREERAKAVI